MEFNPLIMFMCDIIGIFLLMFILITYNQRNIIITRIKKRIKNLANLTLLQLINLFLFGLMVLVLIPLAIITHIPLEELKLVIITEFNKLFPTLHTVTIDYTTYTYNTKNLNILKMKTPLPQDSVYEDIEGNPVKGKPGLPINNKKIREEVFPTNVGQDIIPPKKKEIADLILKVHKEATNTENTTENLPKIVEEVLNDPSLTHDLSIRMLNEFQGQLRPAEQMGLKELANVAHNVHEKLEKKIKLIETLENTPSTSQKQAIIISEKVHLQEIKYKKWEAAYPAVIRAELKENNAGLNLIKGHLTVNDDYTLEEKPSNFFVHYPNENIPTITSNGKEEVKDLPPTPEKRKEIRPLKREEKVEDNSTTTAITPEEREEEARRIKENPTPIKTKIIFTGLYILVVAIGFFWKS